jgi:hypothetical protein
MEITRLIELSFFHYIKDSLKRTRSKERPKSADFRTYNLKYINILSKYPVKVYVNGQERSSTTYNVDYNNALIIFNTALTSTDVVEVDYTYCPVNVYDEGTTPKSVDFQYPAVAVYEMGSRFQAKELGSNKKEKHPTWILDVWTERGGERNDLTDSLVKMFEDGNFSIIDYNLGFPTNSDGTINSSFSEDNIVGYMYVDSINYSKGGSLDIGDKPKFLSEIIIDLIINN